MAEQEKRTAAIVQREDAPLRFDTFHELERISKLLAQAGGSFIGKGIEGPAQVAAIVLCGRELGLGPMASLRGIRMVEGKVGMDASLILAIAQRAGVGVRWLTEATNCEEQSLELTLNGATHVETYTSLDANKAGLLTKDNWRKHPAKMLRARCKSGGVNAFCPHVLSGAVYTPDELEEIQARSAPRVQVAESKLDGMRKSAQTAEPVVDVTPEPLSGDPLAEALEGYELSIDDVQFGEFLAERRTALLALSPAVLVQARDLLVVQAEKIGLSADVVTSRLA